jgi:SAM-dependent methyltransferase
VMMMTTSSLDQSWKTVTPGERADFLYRALLGREVDPGGREHWEAQGYLSAPEMAAIICGSPEYRMRPAGGFGTILHSARIEWARTLPPADRILDIGGSSPTHPEGALIELGYPHRPKDLLIVDLPEDQQFHGTPSFDQRRERTLDWGRVRYVHGDASTALLSEALEHEDPFDMVFMGQFIEHVYQSAVPKICTTAFNALRSGGFLCLDTPNRLLTLLEKGKGVYVDPDHKYEYSPLELIDIIESCGFKLFDQTGILPLPNSLMIGRIDYDEIVETYFKGEFLSVGSNVGYLFGLMFQKM